MKRVVVTDSASNKYFCKWIEDRLPGSGTYLPHETRTIGHIQYNDNGTKETLGVVALNRWTVHTCEGSIASDGTKRLASRAFIYTVYDYAFRHADKQRMNFYVRFDNINSIKLQEALGHKLEARLTDWYGPGIDGLLYGITKKDWLAGRWASFKR